METDLFISMGGLPPLSARGCTQILSVVPTNTLKRTINGDLLDLGGSFKKYHTIIKCQHETSLADYGLYRGCQITIGCIQRLWQKAEPGCTNVLERPAVEGSVSVMNTHKDPLIFKHLTPNTVAVLKGQEGFITYRPLLNMRVLNYQFHTHEWDIKGGWELECEEI